MKKILTILGTITLIGTSTTSLVACNTPQEYTKEQLDQLKKENQINTTDETIKNNLEWIAPQEKPFNTVDNKWYYVVWRGDEKDNWKIVKFKNDTYIIKIDTDDSRQLEKTDLGVSMGKNLYITNQSGFVKYVTYFKNYNDAYFNSVYRWNSDKPAPNLIVNNNGNIKVKGE